MSIMNKSLKFQINVAVVLAAMDMAAISGEKGM